jgi:hypothetical protein
MKTIRSQEGEILMAATTLHRPQHNRKPRVSRPDRSTTLVPRARVEEMLREIAFVLHATRRISQEIREAAAQPE